MQDTRFDKRPRLNYSFSSGKPLSGEERVSAGFKSKRPSRSSSEPKGAASVNSSFSLSGRAGKELPERKRGKDEASKLLAEALQQLENLH